MPKLMQADDVVTLKVAGAGGFHFSAIRPEKLGATEYTLFTLVLDISDSVKDFADDLLNCAKSVVLACQKSPRAENLMLRYLTFNNQVHEIHGFKTLGYVDSSDYQTLRPRNRTSLYDAMYSAVGATVSYAQTLTDQDFDVNGIVCVITDGVDTGPSTMTPKEIANQVKKATEGETPPIESLITILVALKSPKVSYYSSGEVVEALSKFKDQAELSQFVDIGDATPQRLAKLAEFVSGSVSSQSQALGTGGASQTLTF